MKENIGVPGSLVETSESIIEEPTIEVVRSGLTPREEEEMYQRLKNEGKCCEGGEEGWTG